jgi:hypothetical protein
VVKFLIHTVGVASHGQLKQHLPSNLTWKLTVKKAMQLYWTEFLLKEMQGKSTLHFMDQTPLKIGSTHPIWTKKRSYEDCPNS